MAEVTRASWIVIASEPASRNASARFMGFSIIRCVSKKSFGCAARQHAIIGGPIVRLGTK